MRSIDIALTHWGTEPVCRPHAVLFDHPDPAVRAWGEPGCWIWVDTQTYGVSDPRFYCNLIGHEIGHNLGYDHSPDPAHLMHPVVPLAVPGCSELAPQAASDAGRIGGERQRRARLERRWKGLAWRAYQRRQLCRRTHRPAACRLAARTTRRARAVRRRITRRA